MVPWQTVHQLLADATADVAPAIVCRVEVGGEVVFEGAYGHLGTGRHAQPATPQSVFDFASLTKLFTAAACLRLISQGRMGLDDPVTRWVPEFGGVRPCDGTEDPLSKQPQPALPQWSGHPVDADQVTVAQLLTHTSGLPAWRSLYRACGAAPLFPLTPQQIAQRQRLGLIALCAYPFRTPPGTDYLYSDIGLILLGVAMQRAGEFGDLADCLHRMALEPLGIRARFNPPPQEWAGIAATENDPWRERRLRGEVHDENAAGLGGVAGHAGLFGTAADLCRLGRLFLAGGEGLIAPGLVAESIREQVRSPEGIRRGLGWQLRSDPNPTCSAAFSPASFGHTGFTGTSLWCDPERDLCVALLTNRVYHGRDAAGIIRLRPALHAAVVAGLG